jgi:energy-coupling factor transport system ATP-binding protein
VLNLETVSYRYPGADRDAVNNVSVSFKPKSSVAIVGPNGAGKSTLVRLMNGLLRPTKGRVTIDGFDAANMSVAEISRRVGVVFQNPNHQIFSATVRDEVAFALKNFGYPENQIKDMVNSALDKLGLSKYVDKSPFLLSSGEKKRLTIASVIAYEPAVLVFDEPTVGQDHRNKTIIGGIIQDAVRNGRCVISVTHDIDFALTFFDRIVVLANGSVTADFPTSDVGLNPSLMEANGLVPTERMFLKELMRLTGFQGVYEAGALSKHLVWWLCS